MPENRRVRISGILAATWISLFIFISLRVRRADGAQKAASGPSSSLVGKVESTELQREKSSEAIGPLRRAHELEPHDPSILCDLIRALVQAGKIEEAIRFGEDMSGLQPSDPHPEMR